MKKNKESKEENMRVAVGVFLVMFFGTLFTSLYNFNNNELELGIIFICSALCFLSITITAYFQPFLSSLIGLILYTLLTTWLFLSFPEIIFDHSTGRRGRGSFFSYFIFGFILILAAVTDSYNKNNKEKKKTV